MFKIILLPVDLAHLDEAQKTLGIALSIMSEDTEIIMLYVIEDIPNWTDIDLPSDFMEKSMQSARETLQSIAATTDKEVKIELRSGHAYSTILKDAEAANADLIILSSHKPGLKEYFIGSNTTKVVSHANCSVLVVR
jgi:nucleotide-binding universal stress UspA family protein